MDNWYKSRWIYGWYTLLAALATVLYIETGEYFPNVISWTLCLAGIAVTYKLRNEGV